MSSVQIEPEMEARVRQVAHLLGLTQSEVHRRALEAFCDEALSRRGRSRYSDVIGIGSGPPDLSQRAGERFVEALQEREAGQDGAHGDKHPD